ncbi:glycosyltransferase family 4 protein [Salinimicrobium terrae]|uniref:glycosyltransferase family 4 protein n=1 Tax=Salinimicrobium terrae TaxID=470866 RepID=UPI0004025CE7|nr:glycosyltransferase family 4 protein [Salinimicrobium terrae]
MKILHLNDKIEISGGTEVYIKNTIHYLSKIGIESFWIGVYKTGKYTIRIKETAEEITSLSLDQATDYLKTFILNNDIDLIHVHSISDPELLRACFKMVPVVRTMHEPRMFCPGKGKFWRKSEEVCKVPFGSHCIKHAYTQGCMNRHPKRIYNDWKNTSAEIDFSSKKYKAIIVMSQYMKAESLKVGMPAGVLNLNPAFTEIRPSAELERPGEIRILFIGRLSRTKGVHYFIQVGLILLETYPNISFDIVGEGHDGKLFREMIPANYRKNFIFHGWLSPKKVDSYLSKSFLLLFTSIYPEAFGLSGIEAMMHGKPVVGFDVGGVSTWLKHERTGFLVPPKDLMAMAKKVELLIKDEKLYLKISHQAKMLAIQKFSPEVHIKKLNNIYLESLGR